MRARRAVGAVAALLIGGILGRPAEAQGPAGPGTQAEFHLLEASIDDIHAAFRARRLTCRALVGLYLARVRAYDQSGPRLNAVQTVNPRALQEADALDVTYAATGPAGPLHCIPVLLKDQVETSDMPTTYGSALFSTFTPSRDATIVTKLKAAGAVVLGKATMGEFASGYLSSASGVIRNAYDPARHASGSSGGTGAGVAANFATVGIAEDTGGSIRGPAAVASLVGLRPTVPLVSRHGLLPSRPTQDTLGPIARTVTDVARVLEVIAGYDPKDPLTAHAVGQIPASYTSGLTRDGLRGARIGVIRDPMDPKAMPSSDEYAQVRAVIDRAVADLRRLGAEVVEPVTIPRLAERINTPYDANVFETEPAINRYLAEHPNAPVRTLREILLSGTVVPSRARVLMGSVGKTTDDAGYLQALHGASDVRQAVLTQMADLRLDALVYATFDHPPALLGADDMTNPRLDTSGLGNNRRLSPLIGFPALTVPAGFTDNGLPVGLEFLGRPFSEAALIRFAYGYEQGTKRRMPPRTTPPLRDEP